MKQSNLFCLVICLLNMSVFAQKKNITNDSYKDWEVLGNYSVSNDGAYCWYAQTNNKTGNEYFLFNIRKRVLKNLNHGYIDPVFSEDSKKLFIKIGGDSLMVLNIADGFRIWLTRVQSFKQFQSRNKQIIIIRFNDELRIKELGSVADKVFKNVIDFKLNEKCTALVMKLKNSVLLVDLPSMKVRTIGLSGDFNSFTFDQAGDNVVFTETTKSAVSLYFYSRNMSLARKIVDSATRGIGRDFALTDQILGFSQNGNQIYFKLKRKESEELNSLVDLPPNLRIWDYKDEFIASKRRDGKREFYISTICIKPQSCVVQLENDTLHLNSSLGNDYVLLKRDGNAVEAYYRPEWKEYCNLVSVSNGKTIKSNLQAQATLSPAEKFVVWCDPAKAKIFSYNIHKNLLKNSGNQGSAWIGDRDGNWVNIVKWMLNDEMIVLKDKYDLWTVDPTFELPSCSITNSYGRKNDVNFEVAQMENTNPILSFNEPIILSEFNLSTMQSGFMDCQLGHNGRPVENDIDSYSSSYGINGQLSGLKKAKYAKVYLITRQSASESPNLYFSVDLKVFTEISNVHPEKKYNWLSSELIKYPKGDGSQGKAILYKPENFDSSIKYPVIFHYYQERSYELNKYWLPEPNGGGLSIPWYVSNGYLVCVPDIINDKSGRISEEVINSVEGAAKYLTNFSWVNSKRMGIQGHSFGGFETMVLATHSNLFAAAQSSSGPSNLTSGVGGLGFGDDQLQTFYEKGQFNLGYTLWEKPNYYIENSPLFFADRITMPILMMHGNKDSAVPFSQAIEFFSAMRRLQKPCWLLEYNDQDHVLFGNTVVDFTIRQQEFFDYYLKNKPAPEWMKENICKTEKKNIN